MSRTVSVELRRADGEARWCWTSEAGRAVLREGSGGAERVRRAPASELAEEVARRIDAAPGGPALVTAARGRPGSARRETRVWWREGGRWWRVEADLARDEAVLHPVTARDVAAWVAGAARTGWWGDRG